MEARGWTDAKKRAYMLADNKLAENAGWDEELLRSELADLLDAGLPGDLIGFDDVELKSLLDGWESDLGTGTTDPDDLAGLGGKLTITFDAENKARMDDVRVAETEYMAREGITGTVLG